MHDEAARNHGHAGRSLLQCEAALVFADALPYEDQIALVRRMCDRARAAEN